MTPGNDLLDKLDLTPDERAAAQAIGTAMTQTLIRTADAISPLFDSYDQARQKRVATAAIAYLLAIAQATPTDVEASRAS